jgi:hypothetical protein
MTRGVWILAALTACAIATDATVPAIPKAAGVTPLDDASGSGGSAAEPVPVFAVASDGSDDSDTGAQPPPIVTTTPAPVGWLRGSTHVHARPSGDSSEPVASVIAWYEAHGYDFIVLTDHNKVSELGSGADTHGQPFVRRPDKGLIVLAGAELTHNPQGCLPKTDAKGRCRIHVNAIGVTGRPAGKIDWANRKSKERLAKYQSALDEAKKLGATLVQINHPQWFWGMSPELLTELGKRGASLVEVGNAQFAKWNAGDKDHPSMEQLWDAALLAGDTMWGVASDDAHHYRHDGIWQPGGGWIAVHADRDPRAILDAMVAGRFYASTGVVLSAAGVDNGELVVEVAAGEGGTYAIDWIENGKLVATDHARTARRPLPASGYLRADVTRDDGARAWVQPAKR